MHDGLGFGPIMVGVVAGFQFASALLARLWAGGVADRHGAKRAVMLGLAGAALAGALYWLSLLFTTAPIIGISVLLAGRAVLGAAESFMITGATTWGLVRVGSQNAGKVIAWMGTAMFAAFAGGAPLATLLYEAGGFGAVAAATAMAPLGTLLLVSFLEGTIPSRRGSGVEAVRRAPPESRGVAMGAYTACLDLALGTSGPLLGLAASAAGLGAVFLISAAIVVCAVGIGLPMMRGRAA